MTQKTTRATGRTAASAVVAAVIALMALAGPPAARASDYPVRTSTTWELLPDEGVIRVTVTLEITNRQASTVTREECPGYLYCETTTSYYIDQGGFSVDLAATNFSVTTSAGPGSVTVGPHEEGFLPNATVTFPQTTYGQTIVVTTTYDVPGGKPRSGDPVRAGAAYANFCAFPGGVYPGDAESMRVVLPDRYTVEQTDGEPLDRTTRNGKTIFTRPEAATPESLEWHGACFEAVDEDAYVVTTDTSPGGIRIRTESWPEDQEWQDQVSATIGNRLDALEELIGRPADAEELSLTEVVPEALGGYAGIFDADLGEARVSEDALDPAIAAHEVAHAWFNDSFALETWINEGFAEVYARSVTGGEPCERPADAVGRADVADWSYLPPVPTHDDRLRVQDQYALACWVMQTIADRVGEDGMRDVLDAAWAHENPYVGAPSPETFRSTAITWHDLLDLVTERGMAPQGETDVEWIHQLLLDAGATHDADRLDERAAAVARYRALTEATGGWDVPIAVRQPLGRWDFKAATAAMETAEQLDAVHDESVDLVSDLSTSTTVESAYEAAVDDSDLEHALAIARDEAAAAAVVGEMQAAVAAERNPVEAVGLLGEDLPSSEAAAVDALAAGEFDDATSASNATMSLLEQAAVTGGLRLGGVLLGLAIVVAGVLLIRRFLAARSRSKAGDEPAT